MTRPKGELAIVLHTHMPYVEGFGTWPFGEEWLWEAIAGSYLPLLDLLETGAPLTLSLTPVLCDQLEAPGIAERFQRFIGEVRRSSHEEDIAGMREGGMSELAAELERSWDEYRARLDHFKEIDADLLGALARHVQWTSSATHAVLPLLATDGGVRAQVRTGVESHRRRFASQWQGGFWLPECAHASYLDPLLEQEGVRTTCVELTRRYGLGAREHLRPILSTAGVRLVPIDRATIAHVWSDDGYPAHGSYRDYHHHTLNHHKPWANDGGVYDHERALAVAREHAADFVARTIARLSEARAGGDPLPGGGLAVCALDTELLGHWWYEGVHWLTAVVQECSKQGLALVRLDEAAALADPLEIESEQAWGPSTWGAGEDLSTWSGPAVADMAFATRDAELQALAAGHEIGVTAIRELLALQASDWAFMVSRELAGPYPRERFEGHRERLSAALADGSKASTEALRNLAVHADSGLLLGP